MLLILATLLQPTAGDLKTCPSGEVIRAGERCLAMPDHRARSTYVFFDSGKAEVRREWEPVLDAAVAAAKGGRRIIISGHSDTPGGRVGNVRLSRQRAEAVAAALVARGVARSTLRVEATGESQLLVPTAEGVREIHNRRVAITILP